MKVRAFFDEVREHAAPHDGYLAVVEICGFNQWLLKLLPEHGCRETIVVQREGRGCRVMQGVPFSGTVFV
jgi:hypothetical protein